MSYLPPVLVDPQLDTALARGANRLTQKKSAANAALCGLTEALAPASQVEAAIKP